MPSSPFLLSFAFCFYNLYLVFFLLFYFLFLLPFFFLWITSVPSLQLLSVCVCTCTLYSCIHKRQIISSTIPYYRENKIRNKKVEWEGIQGLVLVESCFSSIIQKVVYPEESQINCSLLPFFVLALFSKVIIQGSIYKTLPFPPPPPPLFSLWSS